MRAARALADADRSAIPSARVENPAVACRITDAISDPVDTAQTYVEELLRLPGCFLCYTPMRSPPAVAPAPCAASGFVTFGSFNALAKITDEVIEVRGGGGGVLESMPAACGAEACGACLLCHVASSCQPHRHEQRLVSCWQHTIRTRFALWGEYIALSMTG